MKGRYSKFIKLAHYGGDLLLLLVAFLIGYYTRWETFEDIDTTRHLVVLLLMVVAWTFSIRNLHIFEISRVTQIDHLVRMTFRAIVLNTLIVFTLIVVLKAYDLSRKWLLISYSVFYVAVFIWRILFYKCLKWYRSKGFNYRKVAIVGAGLVGKEMYNFFKSDQSYGYKWMGYFDDNIGACKPEHYLGSLDDIEAYLKSGKIDEIYCALPDYAYSKAQHIMHICDKYVTRFKVIPDFRKFSRRRIEVDFYGQIPVIHQRIEPLQSLANRIKKRIFDIVFSLGVILFVFPWLMPIVAILIKMSSKGPVFFVQERTGLNNESFKCLKFRTMKVNKDSDSKQATKGDSRITRIGAFLRKSNLDELPQFFNVITGSMSVVGPRPHMLKHTEEYSKIIDKFMVRHLCKPGITGWAQVNGYRGETKEPEQMERRVMYDIWYLERWSFFLDLRIIFLTVYNMIKGEENAF